MTTYIHRRIKVHLAHHSRVLNIWGKEGTSGEDLLAIEDCSILSQYRT